MTDPDELLTRLADGLHQRVFERGRAEERLADFVFREGREGAGGGATVEPTGWRYFVSRTLAAAGEAGTVDLLERLSSGEETFATLARDRPAGLEAGLASVDRLGGLAAAGLVNRDLETGRVGLTALGSAILDFARAWEGRAAGRDRPKGPEAR